MIVNEVRIEGIKRNEMREIIFLGDLHAGSRHFSESKLKKAVEYIEARPTARWIGMGDMIECIVPADKRFKPDMVDPRYYTWYSNPLDKLVDIQIKHVVKLLAPIAGQCLGIHGGNHEDAIIKKFAGIIDPLDVLCSRLNVRSLGYGLCIHRVNYADGNKTNNVIINTAHGHQSSVWDGAVVNNLDRLFGYFDGMEIIARGHSHRLIPKANPTIGINRTGKPKVKAIPRWGFATGSFLLTYGTEGAGYAERWDRKPVPIGFAIAEITMRPFKIAGKIETYTAAVQSNLASAED